MIAPSGPFMPKTESCRPSEGRGGSGKLFDLCRVCDMVEEEAAERSAMGTRAAVGSVGKSSA